MSGSGGTIPAPARGLVVTFDYLWRAEYVEGQTDPRKARPCIIVGVTTAPNPLPGAAIHVAVVPITHTAPQANTRAVEVPDQHKAVMGLDSAPCWVICDEHNFSAWPGYDLRQTPQAADGWTRGTVPTAFLVTILTTIQSALAARELSPVSRL